MSAERRRSARRRRGVSVGPAETGSRARDSAASAAARDRAGDATGACDDAGEIADPTTRHRTRLRTARTAARLQIVRGSPYDRPRRRWRVRDGAAASRVRHPLTAAFQPRNKACRCAARRSGCRTRGARRVRRRAAQGATTCSRPVRGKGPRRLSPSMSALRRRPSRAALAQAPRGPPFALLVAEVEAARESSRSSGEEARARREPPIVSREQAGGSRAVGRAGVQEPGHDAYTTRHHLLPATSECRRAHSGKCPTPSLATRTPRADEPIARFCPRPPIAKRTDDSSRAAGRAAQLRRSRGYSGHPELPIATRAPARAGPREERVPGIRPAWRATTSRLKSTTLQSLERRLSRTRLSASRVATSRAKTCPRLPLDAIRAGARGRRLQLLGVKITTASRRRAPSTASAGGGPRRITNGTGRHDGTIGAAS